MKKAITAVFVFGILAMSAPAASPASAGIWGGTVSHGECINRLRLVRIDEVLDSGSHWILAGLAGAGESIFGGFMC